jgi:Caspase domain
MLRTAFEADMHATKLFAAVIACVALLQGPAAHAENRALLIGASGYPSHIGALKGPGNDVKAIWDVLVERGFKSSNMRVLADALPEATGLALAVRCRTVAHDPDCPTFSAITKALEQLSSSVQRGDYVVLFFSGHGVQVPDLVKRDEPDGLTEGFVPLDIGRWDTQSQSVRNLVTDDIVGAAIEAMRDKGAIVWAIFDTCHAGDMTRGAASYAVPRMVAGDVLGIPANAYAEARTGKGGQQRKGGALNVSKNKRADGLVGFYAAQSDQLALELAFQEQDGSGKPTQFIMGGLTNALRRALAQEPNATYRQLAQRITGLYGTFGADMPAPYFEGDLDKPVFSDTAAEPIWSGQMLSGKLVTAGGELHGIDDGAILSVFESSGPATQPIGYAKVDRSSVTQSVAAPTAYNDKAAPQIAEGRAMRVKLERPGLRSMLRVALPPAEDTSSSAAGRSGVAVIDALRQATPDKQTLAIEWLAAGQPADMHLRVRDGRIWMLSSFGDWIRSGSRQSPSILIADPESTAVALRENLWRVARVGNLERLAGSYRQSTRGIEGPVAKSLAVELFLYRDPRAASGPLVCPAEPVIQGAPPTGAVRMVSDSPPDLRHCDIVYVVMRNTGPTPVDVTLLYLEAEAQVQCFANWGKSRIEPREVRDRIQSFRVVTRDPQSGASLPIGREALLVIGVEKPARDAIETTFCHLQQKSLDSARSRAVTRSGSGDAFSALMDQAGLALENTRGLTAVGRTDLNAVTMRTFSWNVRDGGRK